MYKYFTDKELECKHCEAEGIDPTFMQKVDKLRGELGFAFPITSAYRCPDHPIEARKNAPGAHASGRAVDIAVRGEQAYKLLQAALNAGFTGIGVSQKGGVRFIHLDDLPDSKERPRPHVWSY
jgi:zinc D-Ala-D-Ala carboxypeptidase